MNQAHLLILKYSGSGWSFRRGWYLDWILLSITPPPPRRRIDWKLLGFSHQFHTHQQLFVTGSFHLLVFCIGFTETNDNSFTRQKQFVTWSFYLCHYHHQQSFYYQLKRKSSNAVQSMTASHIYNFLWTTAISLNRNDHREWNNLFFSTYVVIIQLRLRNGALILEYDRKGTKPDQVNSLNLLFEFPSFARGRPLWMIICKRPASLDDHLQEAGPSGWSFARSKPPPPPTMIVCICCCCCFCWNLQHDVCDIWIHCSLRFW